MTPRRPHRRLSALCLSLAVAAALFSAWAPIGVLAAADDTWTEIRGTDFRLIGHSSPERLGRIACDIERVAKALRPMRPALTPFTTPVIIAAAGERDMRELLPQYWEQRGARPVGAYWGGAFGHHVVVRVDVPPRERLRRILHEYAHFVTQVTGTEPPLWLDEGLSELWTHAVVDTERIVLGRPVSQHMSVLRSNARWISVPELTSAKALPSSRDRRRVASFYAGSWALVHYLVVGQPGGLRNALAASATQAPTDEALRTYIRSGELPTLTLLAPEAAATCDAMAQSLPTDEASLLKARAIADSPRPEAATPLLGQILEQEPDRPEALETLGMVHFLGNRQAEAAGAFERVIAAGGASHVSYYYRAVLAANLPRRADGSGVIPVANYLIRAIQLNQAFAPARERLKDLQTRP